MLVTNPGLFVNEGRTGKKLNYYVVGIRGVFSDKVIQKFTDVRCSNPYREFQSGNLTRTEVHVRRSIEFLFASGEQKKYVLARYSLGAAIFAGSTVTPQTGSLRPVVTHPLL